MNLACAQLDGSPFGRKHGVLHHATVQKFGKTPVYLVSIQQQLRGSVGLTQVGFLQGCSI